MRTALRNTAAPLCAAGLLFFAYLPAKPQDRLPALAPPPNLAVTTFKVYPADCNDLDVLFGGKTLAVFDQAAGCAVRRFLYGSPQPLYALTKSCSAKFLAPGRRGDMVTVYADIAAAKGHEITVRLTLWRERRDGQDCLAEGEYLFASVDAAFKPADHGLSR